MKVPEVGWLLSLWTPEAHGATICTYGTISLGLARFKIWGFRMKFINLCFVLCLEAFLFIVYFGGPRIYTHLSELLHGKMRRSWEERGEGKSRVRTYCKKQNKTKQKSAFGNKDSLVQTSGPLRIWKFSSWNVPSLWNLTLGTSIYLKVKGTDWCRYLRHISLTSFRIECAHPHACMHLFPYLFDLEGQSRMTVS